MTNSFEEFCDEILVLSLERSHDRKNHIFELFRKHNIQKYYFFKGVDYKEQIVQEAKENGLLNLKKKVGCIRCGKNKCKCRLSSDYLIDTEIANWLSFIKIFEYLKKNNIKKALIMEDDIIFTENGIDILNEVFNQEYFLKNKLDLDKPLILRVGSGFNKEIHEINKKPILNKNYRMSNPCFFVNDKFVDFFLSKYKPICYTSDFFLHKLIFERNKSDEIQHYSIWPSPIYELSWGFKKSMSSLIRDVI